MGLGNPKMGLGNPKMGLKGAWESQNEARRNPRGSKMRGRVLKMGLENPRTGLGSLKMGLGEVQGVPKWH